jgi:cyclophilin family peptidyl-prolyl cis-trans isomerase
MFKALSKYSIIIGILLLLPTAFFLSGCNRDQTTTSETASEVTSEPAQNTETPDSQDADDETSSPEPTSEENSSADTKSEEMSGNDDAVENKGGNPVVIIKTSKGDIKVELDKEDAPISTDNFLAYVEDGYYDGTIFHRVINNFMVQGGGFTAEGQQKPTKAPIKNEADNGLKNDRGTIAMARTAVVDSATSQFYINLVDNDFLNNGIRDFGYAVFGKVVDGMDVVDAIAAVPTGPGDVPNETVVIESVTIAE